MKNKMITLDENTYKIAQEISEEYRNKTPNRAGGFSWWIRRALRLWDEGADVVEEREQVRRNFNACIRIATLTQNIYAELYPDREPLDVNLIVAQAINQRDLREWIE